jgi:hypothetical protein
MGSGAVVEDSGATWSALYISLDLGGSATLASLGFVALMSAQCVARFTGDRFVDRIGQQSTARLGGLIVAYGMGFVLAVPSVAGTIAGFAAAGWGSATWTPAAFEAADKLPGFRAGAGITLASWLMRVALLGGPPLVGAIADATSLRVGLLVVPVAGLLVMTLSKALSPKREGGLPRAGGGQWPAPLRMPSAGALPGFGGGASSRMNWESLLGPAGDCGDLCCDLDCRRYTLDTKYSES